MSSANLQPEFRQPGYSACSTGTVCPSVDELPLNITAMYLVARQRKHARACYQTQYCLQIMSDHVSYRLLASDFEFLSLISQNTYVVAEHFSVRICSA